MSGPSIQTIDGRYHIRTAAQAARLVERWYAAHPESTAQFNDDWTPPARRCGWCTEGSHGRCTSWMSAVAGHRPRRGQLVPCPCSCRDQVNIATDGA